MNYLNVLKTFSYKFFTVAKFFLHNWWASMPETREFVLVSTLKIGISIKTADSLNMKKVDNKISR